MTANAAAKELDISPQNSPWAFSADQVAREYGVGVTDGLLSAEALSRRQRYGRNQLRTVKKRSAIAILIDQLRSTVVLLLAVAAVLSFIFGGPGEGIAILAVILINTLIGFVVELRAVRSMDALRKLGSVETRVRRDGQPGLIPAEDIVPGDILVLEAGDTVTADARILIASRLRADESTFTGESVPVDKKADAVLDAKRVDQQANMIFKGTSLTMGSCDAVVVRTGMETELGRISRLTESSENEVTPLEKQLATVGNKLIVLTVFVAALVIAAGVLAGKPITLMVETGIALAVATIPEGMPIVATIALARGLWRMARRNALINRLSAVETLGSTSVLCTDKTGTLTENRMHVDRVRLATGEVVMEEVAAGAEGGVVSDLLRSALEVGVFCNRASLKDAEGDEGATGDPLEVALLMAGKRIGLSRSEMLSNSPEVGSVAFDSTSKLMATFHERDGKVLLAVKGAPEAVISRCHQLASDDGTRDLDDSERKRWLGEAEKLAQRGLRLIAVAKKEESEVEDDPYHDLTLVGLLGLIDPPRLEVRDAVQGCRDAGIRVLMITGDHPATAGAIAQAVGLCPETSKDEMPEVVLGEEVEDFDALTAADRERLLGVDLFARVSPAQKLNIIQLHQGAGAMVGMIGDGVNDAPALKRADIGVAMGQRGTQVAREAADMVLRDDAFSSVVAAVEQGRIIFGNIRRFVVYLLSCNLSEVMILGFAAAVKAPLPILPLQILFLNLVSDIFPALALGVGAGSTGVMKRPPRAPSEGILSRSQGRWIAAYGLLITFAVLTAFWACLGPLAMSRERAVTVAFLTLAFAQLWHVFNMADLDAPIFRNEITRNPVVWGALALCVLLLGVAIWLPPVAALLQLEVPSLSDWALILSFSVVPLVVGQASRLWRRAFAPVAP